MVDKSKQLVTRLDLYGSYLVSITVVVSICELPIVMWWLDLSRYVLPVGRLILLVLGIKRMWLAKSDNGLTSELQFYKLMLGVIIAFACGGFANHLIASFSVVRTNQFGDIGKLVFVVNGVVGFGVYAIGVIVVWLVDKIRNASDDDSV
jgi:hypothetical protein